MKIKEGEKLPSISLYLITEKGAEKISLQKLIENKKVIIFGLPGAFTSVCSAKHLPSFVNSYSEIKEAGIEKIICVSVNDPFVMKAWGENKNVGNKILMAGDPFLKFTKAIGAEVDKSAKGLGVRSNRYTMLVEHDVVKKIEEEKDTATCKLSAAENFLKTI